MNKLEELEQTIKQLPERQQKIAGVLIAKLDLTALGWFLLGCNIGAGEGAGEEVKKLLELLS